MKDWCPQMHILEQAAAQAGRPLRLAQKELLSKQLMGGDLLATLGTGHGKSLCFQLPFLCAQPHGGKAPLGIVCMCPLSP